MSSSWCLQCYLFFTLSILNIVQTVPPEYCLSPLNSSDCNLPPKQVFSYYKPGSRCELETWRGCPTLNMFENEYHCSLNCIFRMKVEDEPVDYSEQMILIEKLEELDEKPLEEINDILQELIEHEDLSEDDTEYVTEYHEYVTEEEPESETEDEYHEETTTDSNEITTDGHFDEVLTP